MRGKKAKVIRPMKRKASDMTKPNLRRFFDTVKISDELPLNKDGFWKKPEFHREFQDPNKPGRNR